MKVKNYITAALVACSLGTFYGCSDFLDRDIDNVIGYDQVFSDEKMILSALANFYGRVNYAQENGNRDNFTMIDEGIRTSGEPSTDTGIRDDFWRVYDYGLIRNINQFLEGLRSTQLDENKKQRLEGEVRFLRAYVYFCMCRSLGGMPIVGDKVFEYNGPQDVPSMQIARSTEEDTYRYIISECQAAADMLPADHQINGARPNKWAAKMLEARAALYAASLAKYNNLMANPITTPGHECGIPAGKAQEFYEKARSVAEDVIKNSGYKLVTNEADPGSAFYKAVCVKDNNTEVIWARDRIYPGAVTEFTLWNIPPTVKEDQEAGYSGAALNLVEDFEYRDGRNNRSGEIITKEANGNYKLYDSADAPFKDKDGRCWGTVIYPGAEFRKQPIVLQAGQAIINTDAQLANPELKTAEPGTFDQDGTLITSINGPVDGSATFINKSGFFYRKYLDEETGASMRGHRSAMWDVHIRFAEAYSIAGEAAFELGDNAAATGYFNKLRERGGLKPLSSITFDDIVREDRVEFALEDHRYWDVKRWRIAHKIWNRDANSRTARLRVLYPYLVKSTDPAKNGKWIFVEKPAEMRVYPMNFEMKNYYNFVNMDWVNNNPLFVKNPYQ